MRIAYFVRLDVSRVSGVSQKIVQQAKAWIRHGHDVKVFVASPSPADVSVLAELDSMIVSHHSFWQRIRGQQELFRAIKSWNPDMVYYRFGIYAPFQEVITKQIPTILEANTNDLTEYSKTRSRLSWWFHRLTRGLTVRQAVGVVAVTHEILEGFLRPSLSSTVIANGVDLKDYSLCEPKLESGVRAVFIGSPGLPWHGVDKILELAEALPEWTIDIVGYGDLRDTVRNVRSHGYLPRKEYERILCEADVAFGTLALHRTGMNEACPLKTREYLALGLPIITAYHDPDIPQDSNYVLQLPNHEENVREAVPRIDAFGSRWQGKRVERSQILSLDSERKELARLEFFKKCLSGSSRKARSVRPDELIVDDTNV